MPRLPANMMNATATSLFLDYLYNRRSLSVGFVVFDAVVRKRNIRAREYEQARCVSSLTYWGIRSE